MNRHRWIALAAAVVVLAGGGAWWWKGRAGTAAPKYRTAAVERGAIEATVAATGTVRPVVQVEVGSQVSGTLQHIGVDFNSRVRKGQVLAQIDPSSFRARYVQSQAAVAKAEAAVKDARRVLDRAKQLLKESYISQAEVDGHDVALEQRVAELAQAKAQLQVSRVDLDNTTIRTPIDGVVIARSVELGQTVAASLQAPKLFVIANDLAQMQVETRIDEADIGRISAGLPVTFSVDAFPDRTFEGRVSQVRLEPITEQNVVTYTTVIHTENPDFRLRPGMTANVSVLVAKRDDVVKVPAAALRFRPPMERGAAGRGGPGGPGGMRAAGGPGGAGGAGAKPAGTVTFGGSDRGAAMAGPATSGGTAMRGGPGGASGERRMRGGPGGGDGTAMRGGPGGGMAVRGGAGGASGGMQVTRGESAGEPDAFKPGTVYVLKEGKPVAVPIMTGLTDGAFVEVRSSEAGENAEGAVALDAGAEVVVGLEASANRGPQMMPPPGMGGPQFRGPGGGGGNRGGGGGGGGQRGGR